MKNVNLFLLKLGAFQTLIMAIYHFIIPFQFGWENYLSEKSPTINWSLYALNNYFSFNLLVLAMALLYFLIFKIKAKHTIITLSTIVLIFWVFSGWYQFVSPMPLPVNLKWLSLLLPGLAIFNALIFVYPIINWSKDKR